MGAPLERGELGLVSALCSTLKFSVKFINKLSKFLLCGICTTTHLFATDGELASVFHTIFDFGIFTLLFDY